MSNTAIKVENLGKEYKIGKEQVTHDRLTSQLSDMVKAPFRRVGNLLRGQATGAAELHESMWALDDVSFEIKRGEAVAIIGRNGAGKSTLLKVLSRITEPTRGQATIYGRVGSLLEVGTGFHPELTGRENVFLNGAILGMRKHEIEKRFDEIVAFAEVEKFIDTPVKHYSSGMYVRLAFSVAAHLEPEVLLVDEVLAVGDLAFQRKCLGKMDDVTHEGRTVLFVSHNMSLVQSLCKRGIFLSGGQKVLDAPIEQAIDAYLQTLQQMEKVDLAERTDRRGAGKVRVTQIDIDDHSDNAVPILRTGHPVTFTFHVNGEVVGMSCLFVIFNHLGQRVAIFKSDATAPQDRFVREEGALKYVCHLEQLLLTPGRYHLNFLVRGGGEWQDFVEAAVAFDVQAGELNGRPISPDPNFSVTIPHTWTYPTEI